MHNNPERDWSTRHTSEWMCAAHGSKEIVFIAADEHAARRRPVRVGRRATPCEVHRRVDAERSCAAVAAARLATR